MADSEEDSEEGEDSEDRREEALVVGWDEVDLEVEHQAAMALVHREGRMVVVVARRWAPHQDPVGVALVEPPAGMEAEEAGAMEARQ